MRARFPMLPLLALVVAFAAACYEPASGDQAAALSTSTGEVPTATPVLVLPAPVILSIDTPTPGPAPQPAPATATPLAAPSEVEASATPTDTEVTPTATIAAPATSTPTPATEATPPPGPDAPADAVGFPFTSTQLVSAIASNGLTYSPRSERIGCEGHAAEVRRLDGPDGPPVTLWVYASPEDQKLDWVRPSSGAPQPRIAGCEVDGGWIYWYENLVMAFEPQAEWIPQGAVREAIVDAFFTLSR